MNGTIRYNSDGEVSFAIHNDKWCVVKSGNSEISTTKYEGSCALSTDPSAFTYEDVIVIESLEAGDNCVNWFKENMSFDDTNATTICNGGSVDDITLIEFIEYVFEDGLLNISELEEAGAIKNAVYILSIKITDYNKAIGSPDVVIPSQIDGKPVVKIGEWAFNNNQLTSVTIPSSVTSIEWAAFSNNQLTSVTIPDSVTFIGADAFKDNQLTSITIPNSVTYIGTSAFNGNQLPDSQAFIYARNSDGSIDNTTLVSYGGARKENVVIPSSVTFIGDDAFSYNQLTSVTIPSSVTSIGWGTFSNNPLTSVTIPNSVTSIGGAAFFSNQLTSVTIENGSATIGCDAFNFNDNLTTVKYGGVDTPVDELPYENCR